MDPIVKKSGAGAALLTVASLLTGSQSEGVTQEPANGPTTAAQSGPNIRETTKLPHVAALRAGMSRDALASMSLSPLGFEVEGRLPDNTIVFSRQQVQQQVSQAAVSATKILDSNSDGAVTAGELREFAYIADRLGNRDGTLAVVEYNLLFTAGLAQHLVDVGKSAGLSAESLTRLEDRLANGQFSLSGRNGFSDAFDIAQMSNDPLTTAEKTQTLVALFEEGAKLAPNDTTHQVFKREFLERLATTGEALVVIDKKDDGTLVFASDSARVSETPTGAKEYRYATTTFYLPPTGVALVSDRTQVANSSLVVVPDSAYHYPASTTNPFVESAIRDITRALKDNRELKNAVEAFLNDSEKISPERIETLLSPIVEHLAPVLRTRTDVTLEVEAQDPQSPHVAAVYRHPQPGADAGATISLFISPFVAEARTRISALQRSGVSTQEALEMGTREMKLNVLRSLFEEVCHAGQHHSADVFTSNPSQLPPDLKDRIADYARNRATPIDPTDIRQFFGDLSLYEQQPLEADAKAISIAVITELMRQQ